MTKRGTAVQEQELFPMKDVTPKKAATKPEPPQKATAGGRAASAEHFKGRDGKVFKADPKKPEPKSAKPQNAVAIHKPTPPASPAPSNFLSVIITAAADPRCDVAKMQALLDMQERIEAREAKKTFQHAFRQMRSKLPIINRDGKIEVREKDAQGGRTGKLQQSTPYATYPALMTIVDPLLDAYGFTFSTVIRPIEGGRIEVVSTLTHDDGHERTSSFPLGADTTGSKNNAQGWGSSQQYGMRYNLIAILNIVTKSIKEADTNGFPGDFNQAVDGTLIEKAENKPKITKEQFYKISELLTAAKIPEQRFCEKYGLKVVNDLPAELFAAAEKAIKDHQASKGAARG